MITIILPGAEWHICLVRPPAELHTGRHSRHDGGHQTAKGTVMPAEVTLSYSHGASGVTLLGETIGENLGRIAAAHPDAEALVDVPTGRRWTYAAFGSETDT